MFKLNTSEKLGFFRKVKIAIFNLEKYGLLIAENVKHSIKYLIILVIISSICFSIVDIVNINNMINKGIDYIENQMPDFELKNGEILLESPINAYDEEYGIKLISINENSLTESELQKYKNDEKTIILLKDKIVLNAYGVYNEYSYNYLKQVFDVEEINKKEFIDLYRELNFTAKISTTMFIALSLSFFIVNFYETILYSLIVATFGYFVAQIGRIRIKFSTSLTLAIYSLTLSIILNLIYIVQYNFTGFEIPYFEMLYLLIAYIYIIAAILIIKTDLINQVMQLQRIQEEQKKISQENNEENEPNIDKKKDKKEKKEEQTEEEKDSFEDEPDGSEI